ncbi:hypothetical protein [Candidatus Rariloculus sp.]|uniref:hypothetical protein n=1 Tax=Candidatus Rariloculus sp. TaxID=3101265 RepID=UPI003D122FF4
MKHCFTVAALAAALLAATSATAQWPRYPTPAVPRTADGQVDLDAPAPRTAEGYPDLSGLWRVVRNSQNADAAPEPPPDGPPVAGFRDVAANIEGGLPLQPWARTMLDEREAGGSKDNPEAHCLPMGNMQFHTQGAPRRYVHTPGMIIILYEASMGVRQIFSDGRPSPDNDPQPWWYGYSTGRWDDDTFVVVTTHFRDGEWLDIIGSPLTDAATVTERFTRPSFGRMEIDITVDDPRAYTEPWTVRVNQEIMVDEDLIEFVCLENQRFGQ